MRLVKTGKSIMNLAEEANNLIKMVYGPIGRSHILKVIDIGLNDQDEITRINGQEYIPSDTKIEE